MDEREFLTRIDRHMERGNEHMARGNEHLARGNEHMEHGNTLMAEIREEMRLSREQRDRAEAAAERHAQEHLDTRDFMRQLILRMERFSREQVAEMRALTRIVSAQTTALERFGDEMRAELREQREESRAQRGALLRILDKLDGGEPGGSSAPA